MTLRIWKRNNNDTVYVRKKEKKFVYINIYPETFSRKGWSSRSNESLNHQPNM
jgi:hypothetical protein